MPARSKPGIEVGSESGSGQVSSPDVRVVACVRMRWYGGDAEGSGREVSERVGDGGWRVRDLEWVGRVDMVIGLRCEGMRDLVEDLSSEI